MFTQKKIPATVFAVGMALERNPQACNAMVEAGWEVASHGYRWLDYQDVDEETEREHIERTIEIHKKMIGTRPTGIYQGKPNVHTRKIVAEAGGFMYDSDAYDDDLPYWTFDYGGVSNPHLIIPYTLSENDMKFVSPGSGFTTGQNFSTYLKETLKFLVEEGKAGQPKMMTVGLHGRLMRPGRAAGLADFMDYAKKYGKDVWICTREEIAKHWYEHHYPVGAGKSIEEFMIEKMNLENAANDKFSSDISPSTPSKTTNGGPKASASAGKDTAAYNKTPKADDPDEELTEDVI